MLLLDLAACIGRTLMRNFKTLIVQVLPIIQLFQVAVPGPLEMHKLAQLIIKQMWLS